MRICLTCLNAVPPDLEHCPFCSAEVEPTEFEEAADEDIEWRIACVVNTVIEATLIAGRLRAYGIPAFVLSQVDSTRNFTVGSLAVAKVFVPDRLLADTERILRTPEDLPDQEEEERAEDQEEERTDNAPANGRNEPGDHQR